MSEINDLPGQVASDIQEAIDNQSNAMQERMHDAEVKLEQKRINAETKAHELEVEKELQIAQMQNNQERPAWVDELMSEFRNMWASISSPAPSVEIDASHEETTPISTEDETPNIPEAPQEEPEELVEEIGNAVEEQNPLDENVEEEAPPKEEENGNRGFIGRRKRRGRR